MPNIRNIKILDFPQDGRIWYISWIIGIKKNDYVPGDLSLACLLVPTRNNELNNDFIWEEKEIFYVSVGAIPFIERASYWKNGTIVKKQTQTSEVVELIATPHRMEFVQASSLWPERKRKTNESNYSELNDSPLLKTQVLRYKKRKKTTEYIDIFIPAYEVFRFYYGFSTPFVSHILGLTSTEVKTPSDIFKYFIKSTSIVKMNFSEQANGTCIIVKPDVEVNLTSNAYNLDAPILAKYFFSDEDNYVSKQIFNVINSINTPSSNKYKHIKILPPFMGVSRLNLSGTWTKDKKPVFIVNKILTCANPFPFKNLYIGRENDGRSVDNDGDLLPYGQNFKTVVSELDNKSGVIKQITSKKGASRKVTKTKIQLEGNRFSGLRNVKVIIKEKDKQTHINNSFYILEQPTADDLTTTPQTESNTPTGKVDLIENHSVNEKEVIKADIHLMDVITTIKLISDYIVNTNISFIPARNNYQHNHESFNKIITCDVPTAKTKSGKPQAWNEGAEGRSKRQVLVAELVINKSYLYLIEIERTKPSPEHGLLLVYSRQHLFEELNTKSFEKIIDKFVLNTPPTWPKKNTIKGLSFQSLKHIGFKTSHALTAGYWAERIIKILKTEGINAELNPVHKKARKQIHNKMTVLD
jgi:hypothetical protein